MGVSVIARRVAAARNGSARGLARVVVCTRAALPASLHSPSSARQTAQPPSRPLRAPPPRPRPRAGGTLPGLLLIADRGNNRLLLVDSRKRIVWRDPRPGARLAFPFRYPDDAFFGPGYRTIISNQEDQNTIQVIAFPSGRLLWHYGHPDVAGSAPATWIDRTTPTCCRTARAAWPTSPTAAFC